MSDIPFRALVAKLTFLIRSYRGRLPEVAMRNLENYLFGGEVVIALEVFCGELIAHNVPTTKSEKELLISMQIQLEQPHDTIDWVNSELKTTD